MESQRTLLWVAFFAIILLLWNAWEKDMADQRRISAGTTSAQSVPVAASDSSAGPSAALTSSDSEHPAPAHPAAATDMRLLVTHKSQVIPTNRIVHIRTDVLDVELDRLGGRIVSVKLVKYPEAAKSNLPVELLNYTSPDSRYFSGSGIISANGQRNSSNIIFNTAQDNYQLGAGANNMQVVLTSTLQDNVTLQKVFTFERDKYLVDVNFKVNNNSNALWAGYMYNEISRTEPPKKSGSLAMSTFTGAAISSPAEHFEKIPFKTMRQTNLSRNIQGGWAAMLQHYFLSVWIPNQESTSHYYTNAPIGDLYTVGFAGRVFQVPSGQSQSVGAKFYSGPAVPSRLSAAAPHLELAVDYGKLWFISEIIFSTMQYIHHYVGNWGWSIIFVTLIIKLLFYKLSESSYRSMARMRELQPKLEELKKRYGDDKQRMTAETMELYKREKVNPFGGCLALLPQIPVFLALYWVLVESVQLRHAPFMLWIHDLSTKDPFFILPILMGASMFLQQKMSPAPPDPIQAKVMMFMPVVFTALFIQFPSGLVLYWLTNNLLSILQQWYIMRSMSNSSKKKPNQSSNKLKWLTR